MSSPAYWRRAGADAFLAGTDHGANPHLPTVRRRAVAGDDSSEWVALAQHWWDGWEAEYFKADALRHKQRASRTKPG